MQITLNAGNPAETRLIAAFLNDLADLQALQHEKLRSAIDSAAERTAPVLAAPTQAEATAAITPPKKARATPRPCQRLSTAMLSKWISSAPFMATHTATICCEAASSRTRHQ